MFKKEVNLRKFKIFENYLNEFKFVVFVLKVVKVVFWEILGIFVMLL